MTRQLLLFLRYSVYIEIFAVLFFLLVSVSCAALSDDMKQEIVAVHNTLRRNFANGAEGTMVGNMKKMVSIT